MSAPKRIQLRRTKGWRKPEGAVVVARPSKWGNPYRVETVDRHGMYPFGFRVLPEPSVANRGHVYRTEADAVDRAVALYRQMVSGWRPEKRSEVRDALAGHDLACWCPLDQTCHADVLLEIANGGAL